LDFGGWVLRKELRQECERKEREQVKWKKNNI